MTVSPYSRRLETGPWFSAGNPLDARGVAERLQSAREDPETCERPYCVYVHVPYCSSICSFCALYTRAVSPDADAVFDAYLDAVSRSLAAHPWRGRPTSPTTVHFGGGTPLMLGPSRFGRLVNTIAEAFGSTTTCEWAVETTTSSLEPDMLDALAHSGVRRIHVGIQTLDDATRQRVGRHESGAKALDRLCELQARGFFASVDLIVGFDGLGLDVIEDDLRRLYDVGVRMFSICELRERGTVRLGMADEQARLMRLRDAWRAIWAFMEGAGLKPIHLGQFGRSQDDNRYFTHPARGEDCLAVGPYAHGCAGDVSYGNLLLPDYFRAVEEGRLPVESAVEYGCEAAVIRGLERDLLAHRVPRETVAQVIDVHANGFTALFDRWTERGLVEWSDEDAVWAPSVDGSWFIGNMITEARGLLDPLMQRVALRSA